MSVMAKTRKRKRQGDLASDQPITKSDFDVLNRSGFATGLADQLRAWKGNSSLAVGLCGEWGCGKTSLKNMVLEQLQKGRGKKPNFIDFNPWQFSGRDSVSAAFFEAIESALAKTGPKSDGVSQEQEVVNQFQRYAKWVTFTGSSLHWLGKASDLAIPGSSLVLGGTGSALQSTGKILEQAADVAEAEKQNDGETRENPKQALTAAMAKLTSPIIVVIDDIDRLTTSEIREIVQLVKVNGDFPNLTYLLLFDRAIVAAALDEISGGKGDAFLDKIIQVMFHVPHPPLANVHQALFDGLDRVVGRTEVAERWNRSRYAIMWNSGLKNYFTNLRRVYRFLNSYAFQAGLMRNGNTFELNPVDLLTLEVLRLYESSVFESLPLNRDLLVGTYKRRIISSSDRETFRDEQFTAIVNLAPENRRDEVRSILASLFPYAAGGDPDDGGLIRELRVGTSDMFDRYFSLSFSEGVSQAEIDTLKRSLTNPLTFSASCERLKGRGELLKAFQILDANLSGSYPMDLSGFISTLCDAADQFPEADRQNLTGFGCHEIARFWIRKALKENLEEGERLKPLREGVGSSKGVSLPVFLAAFETRGRDDDDHFLLKESDARSFIRLVTGKIRSQKSKLRELPHLTYILYRWKEWAGIDDVRAYLRGELNSPDDSLWILRTFLHIMTSSNGQRTTFTRTIDLKILEEFSSAERLKDLTSTLIISDLKSIEDQRATRAFRYALQQNGDVINGQAEILHSDLVEED